MKGTQKSFLHIPIPAEQGVQVRVDEAELLTW